MFATVVCAIGRGSRQRMLQLIETASAQLAPNGSLHLVHAVEGLPSSASPDDWAIEVMAAAETRLSEALRSINIPASIHVRAGNPSQVIVVIAKDIAADLVLIASHRDDVIDRVFGSVVDHAARTMLRTRLANDPLSGGAQTTVFASASLTWPAAASRYSAAASDNVRDPASHSRATSLGYASSSLST